MNESFNPSRTPSPVYREQTINLPSVTTLIRDALGTSKPLVEWNVTQAAEAAFDKINTLKAFAEDGDRDGAIKWLKDARWVKTDQAKARGTDIHNAAEALALGTIPEVAPEIEPYVRQYQRFLEEFQPEFLLAEAPVYNTTIGYAGTLDAVANIQGSPVVADIKTTPHGPNSGRSRPPYPEVALQLTLYRRAELVGLARRPARGELPPLLRVRPGATQRADARHRGGRLHRRLTRGLHGRAGRHVRPDLEGQPVHDRPCHLPDRNVEGGVRAADPADTTHARGGGVTAKKDYHLTVPPDARCFVPGCYHPPTRILNLRIRTIDTGASYGPNIDGSWLCTRHGDSGAVVQIDYEPTTSGDVV